jgi:7,8-dihydroneopterin aldolase/epimerase/oxygenase
MRFWGKHGVSQHERDAAQPIEVDIEVSADLEKAASSDRLQDTIDYVNLYRICERVVTERSFALLEALAAHIARAALDEAEIFEVAVRLKKPQLFDGATPQVEIRLQRDHSSKASGRGPTNR